MELYGDYHTHSRRSDGKQDAEDIIQAARRRGLKEVAITDHGPLAAVIGVSDVYEYLMLRDKLDAIAGEVPDIKVLVGAEANIRDLKGSLDIPSEVTEELDILIAGLHPYTLPTSAQDGWALFIQNSLRHLGRGQREKAVNNNTKACVEAINNNPQLDILSHPGLFFTVDIEEVAQACVRNEVLFEINCAHEYPDISAIMKAEHIGADFIINSDSHFEDTVGNLDYGIKMVEKLNIDPERVVNRLQAGGGYTQWAKKKRGYTFS
ncbi:MAG: PHP domain-containing protein [Syntrophomonadaceae bacterium]|jgi:putative hydrolase